MGLFKNIKKAVEKNTGKSEKITFDVLPQNEEEVRGLLKDGGTSEFFVAALSVTALCKYESDPEEAIRMLNVLRGPQPMTDYEVSWVRERLDGKEYKARSFFEGATPANNYQVREPFSIIVSSNPYSYDSEGLAILYLKSGGTDYERPVKLRKKVSSGEWFLWEIQYLADIRVPIAEDPWA